MGPKKRTRKSALTCYGPPVKLPDTGCLVTLRDVLAGVDFEKLQFPDNSSRKQHDVVENLVRQKFFQANLPPAIDAAVVKFERASEAAHLLQNKKLKSNRKKHFLDSLDKLFDLVKCQCEIADCVEENHNCSGAHFICSCPKLDKVPDMEAAWLKDQRTKIGTKGRTFVMSSSIDKKEAKKFKKHVDLEEKKIATEDRKKAVAEEL